MLEFQLVLPCYNESKSLRFIVEKAITAAKEAGFNSDRFQLILVENGSVDNSKQILAELELSEAAPWFRKVVIPKNQGYGFGVFQGLLNTEARFVGWSHADQQCDPKDAFVALKRLQSLPEDKVLVKGARNGRDRKDRYVTFVFELIARLLLGIKTKELNAQPKVFSRGLITTLDHAPNHLGFDLYVIYQALKAGYRIENIPVIFPPRVHGVSHWAGNFFNRYQTILRMLKYMFQLSRTQGRI
jgi:glycosyltransferase involved in cell wall biosynthesis